MYKYTSEDNTLCINILFSLYLIFALTGSERKNLSLFGKFEMWDILDVEGN